MKTLQKWETEPNFSEEFRNGYHLVILRNEHMGFLNGYVGVPREHPWFALHYDARKVYRTNVHGGITFSGKGHMNGMKEKYWYFGFDTGHAWDLMPYMANMKIDMGIPLFGLSSGLGDAVYRDFEYVKSEVDNLYGQLFTTAERNPKRQINHFREYRRLHKIKMKHIQIRKEMGYYGKGK